MSDRAARTVLIGLAAALVVGAGVLVVLLNKGGGDDGTKVAKPARSAAKAPAAGPGVLPATGPRHARPEVTKGGTDTPAEASDFRTSVNDDGVVVRDHRKKGAPEVTTPIRVPVKAGKMKPTSIAAVRDALRPLVRKCEADHAPDIDGDRPQLQAVVRVSVDGDRIIAGKTEVSVRDAKADALMDCVKRAAEAIDIPANGHPALDNYALTFPFRLARK